MHAPNSTEEEGAPQARLARDSFGVDAALATRLESS